MVITRLIPNVQLNIILISQALPPLCNKFKQTQLAQVSCTCDQCSCILFFVTLCSWNKWTNLSAFQQRTTRTIIAFSIRAFPPNDAAIFRTILRMHAHSAHRCGYSTLPYRKTYWIHNWIQSNGSVVVIHPSVEVFVAWLIVLAQNKLASCPESFVADGPWFYSTNCSLLPHQSPQLHKCFAKGTINELGFCLLDVALSPFYF